MLHRVAVGLLDHRVEKVLDRRDSEVAYCRGQLTEAVVLAPLVIVGAVIPERLDRRAGTSNRLTTILVCRRLQPIAVQLQVRPMVGQARAH